MQRQRSLEDGKGGTGDEPPRNDGPSATEVAAGIGALGLLALGAAYLFRGEDPEKCKRGEDPEKCKGQIMNIWVKIESKIKQPGIQYDKTEFDQIKKYRNQLAHTLEFNADNRMVTRFQTFYDRL
jgi:hypothetical protein